MVDYLGLVHSETARRSRREELDDMLVRVKQLAVNERIPVVSPWQISREGFERGRQLAGEFTLNSLADTSQTERSADVVLTIYYEDDELNCQILKNRDGETGDFTLTTDFKTSRVTSEVDPIEELLDFSI